jgi:BirA family biotin operon repressor/biotin-[acetyl-CoA-carboxylase] ligase
VQALLRERGLEWPAAIEWHESVGSTNDLLHERARGGAPAWTSVIAGRQAAGRGRHGRSWSSEPGNLFLSVLLRPEGWPPGSTAVVPLLAGVAVAEAVRGWGVSACLKWPNDVVVAERKLGGILCEASSAAQGLVYAVVGIGVNLCSEPSGEPGRRAISAQAAGARGVGPFEAAAAVLGSAYRTVRLLAPRGAGAVVAAWRALSVPWWGREVEVVSGGSLVVGEAEGVADDGALLLRTGRGTMRVVSGEARELRLRPRSREGRA